MPFQEEARDDFVIRICPIKKKAREEERDIVTGKSWNSMHDKFTNSGRGLHFDVHMNHTRGARTSGPSYISNALERRIEPLLRKVQRQIHH